MDIVKKLQTGSWLWSYKLKPVTNLTVLNYMIKAPKAIAARVRWFELVGNDLIRYNAKGNTNLLYEISSVTLSDFVQYCRENNCTPKKFMIDRSFAGDVLILKGSQDVVFGDTINQKLKEAYPNAKLGLFNDGHRMQKNKVAYKKIRIDFLEKGF